VLDETYRDEHTGGDPRKHLRGMVHTHGSYRAGTSLPLMNLHSVSRHVVFSLSASLLLLGGAFGATLVWEQNFGELVPSTAITTGNVTNLGGANTSNGSLTAISSTIGSGTALQISGATTAGTAAGTWVGSGGFGGLTSMSMEFSVKIHEGTSGALDFYMGSGNTVSNFTNTNRNSSHYLWNLSVLVSTGSLRYLNSSEVYVDTGFVLSEGVDYDFLVQVNATSATLDGVSANSMSIYANGVLVANDLALRAGTSTASAFRIGGRSTATAGDLIGEVDDIRIWNGIQAVPEPSVAGLLAVAAGFLMHRRRNEIQYLPS